MIEIDTNNLIMDEITKVLILENCVFYKYKNGSVEIKNKNEFSSMMINDEETESLRSFLKW